MKTIPNKTTAIVNEKKDPMSFSDLLIWALDQTPQGGFDRATIKARNRVEDAIKKGKKKTEIELEDADYETARATLGSCRWGSRHRDIDALYEAFGL